MSFLFLQVEIPPLSLGPWGTLFLVMLSTAFAFLSWRNRNWRSAAEAAEKELLIQRERATRLNEENKLFLLEIGSLKTKTDLKPLMECIQGWTIEGRDRFGGAMTRLDFIHTEQTTTIKALAIEIQAQRAQSESVFRDMTDAFRAHVQEEGSRMSRVAIILERVEQRLDTNGNVSA